jgi:hypothetical protein
MRNSFQKFEKGGFEGYDKEVKGGTPPAPPAPPDRKKGESESSYETHSGFVEAMVENVRQLVWEKSKKEWPEGTLDNLVKLYLNLKMGLNNYSWEKENLNSAIKERLSKIYSHLPGGLEGEGGIRLENDQNDIDSFLSKFWREVEEKQGNKGNSDKK